jgi:hypothetical protein
MCSTPQKQPAAIVSFSEPAGEEIEAEASGFRRRLVEVVKGRMRRVRKVGMVAAMRRMVVVIRRVRGVRGRLAIVFWRAVFVDSVIEVVIEDIVVDEASEDGWGCLYVLGAHTF